MKKNKSALCLVTLIATCATLVSCNKPTQTTDGTIFTYTTATGTVVSYTASELLKSYQTAGNSASTEFDKVYEVLIRKLYQQDDYKTSLEYCERQAKLDVVKQQEAAQNNAESNSTSYKEELEKIFDSLSVDNMDELYDYYLYQEEKTQYESKFNNDNLDAVRDGAESSKGGLTSNDYYMNASEEYGIANKGWIRETMPYSFRHILVKVSAASGEYTQAEISEDKGSTAGEATKLAKTIMRIAGADTTNGTTSATMRETFGEIAKDASDDSGSASNYGGFDDPTTTSTDFVAEFKLGSYAFETLYNQAYKSTTGTEKSYYDSNVATLTPGLTEGAESVSESTIDDTQTLDDSNKTIYDFFKDGETYDDGTSGIGQIPYGAAVALLKAAKITSDDNGNNVYEGKSTFYPRNILFNKYFNKHNICVITPNDIAYNDNSISADSYDGTYSETYGTLPGFSHDTKSTLPQFEHNVLTNNEGNIVLAVRAGTSSYQGIHFIVIQRSALDYDGSFYTPSVDSDKNTTANLSEYYTMSKPGETSYPTSESGQNKITFINYNNESSSQSSVWNTRQGTITTAVKNYNGALSTYIFQKLIENGSIKFSSSEMKDRIQNYSVTKRQSTKDDSYQTWKDSWKTYAEMLEEQNRQRSAKLPDGYKGSSTDKKQMLSEVCAIGYGTHSGADWQEGGRCYYVK